MSLSATFCLFAFSWFFSLKFHCILDSSLYTSPLYILSFFAGSFCVSLPHCQLYCLVSLPPVLLMILCIFVSLSHCLYSFFIFCFLTFVSLSLSLSALCLLLYFLFFACFFVSLYTYFALSVCFVRLILTLTWNKGRTMLRSPGLIIPWILNVKGL